MMPRSIIVLLLAWVLSLALGVAVFEHHLASAHKETAKVQADFDAFKVATAQAQAQSARKVLNEFEALQEKKNAALVQAENRVRANAVAAAAARHELDGLRDASAIAVRTAQESHSACLGRVAAFREVFDHCSARYTDLAEKADGHVSDAVTLIEAWPRKD